VADASLLVRKFLLQDSALTTLCPGGAPTIGPVADLPEHILAGDLPEKADPTVYAPFVTICTEGGKGYPEMPVAADRVKIQVWAGVNQNALARAVYLEIEGWLNRRNQIDLSPDGFIIISQEMGRGQDQTDPENGYATVIVWYEITSRDSA
jgi:hypothetical protein